MLRGGNGGGLSLSHGAGLSLSHGAGLSLSLIVQEVSLSLLVQVSLQVPLGSMTVIVQDVSLSFSLSLFL